LYYRRLQSSNKRCGNFKPGLVEEKEMRRERKKNEEKGEITK
jgi:hypothetical protein